MVYLSAGLAGVSTPDTATFKEGPTMSKKPTTRCIGILQKVAGQVKRVPPDHPWVLSARLVDTCMGDRAGL